MCTLYNVAVGSGKLNIAIRLDKTARKLLLDFANSETHSIAFRRFTARWEKTGLKWRGGLSQFQCEQQLLRKVWEGEKKGVEGVQTGIALGLVTHDESTGPPPVAVDWARSSLFVIPRNLNDLVWLTLLQHSMKLAVCEGRAHGCRTPYFIRSKPWQRVCSDPCAKPLQREAARRWWSQHGPDWRNARKRKSESGEDGK
jgi:hypothetical protein